MHKNRHLKDGTLRDADNWQKLFGTDHFQVCMESLIRHTQDLHLIHDGFTEEARENIEEALCGIMFNTEAYLFKVLLDKKQDKAL
jgi:hypothetical protein